MLFDEETENCVKCKIPTLVSQGREDDKDGFVCKWCDKVTGYWKNVFEGKNK